MPNSDKHFKNLNLCIADLSDSCNYIVNHESLSQYDTVPSDGLVLRQMSDLVEFGLIIRNTLSLTQQLLDLKNEYQLADGPPSHSHRTILFKFYKIHVAITSELSRVIMNQFRDRVYRDKV